MEKLVAKVQVKNALGLHTRPAAALVKLLQDSKSDVFLSYKKETINARSILSILMLGAVRNAKLTLSVEGEDAAETLDMLVNAFEDKFGE